MEFKIEGEVIVKVASMIMEANNRNAELAMKVLDKCCDIADKFVDVAVSSIKSSDERSKIRFEQEQEERKLKLARDAAADEDRRKEYAERDADRKLAAAKRDKEWKNLNK